MKRVIIWLPVSVLVLLALLWFAVTYAKDHADMAVCFLLLYALACLGLGWAQCFFRR